MNHNKISFINKNNSNRKIFNKQYSRSIHKRRLLILSIILILILFFFGFQFIKVHHSIMASQSQIEESELSIKKLKTKNKNLNLKIKQLKNPIYIKKYIINKYLYTNSNEIVYNLPQNNAIMIMEKEDK